MFCLCKRTCLWELYGDFPIICFCCDASTWLTKVIHFNNILRIYIYIHTYINIVLLLLPLINNNIITCIYVTKKKCENKKIIFLLSVVDFILICGLLINPSFANLLVLTVFVSQFLSFLVIDVCAYVLYLFVVNNSYNTSYYYIHI